MNKHGPSPRQIMESPPTPVAVRPGRFRSTVLQSTALAGTLVAALGTLVPHPAFAGPHGADVQAGSVTVGTPHDGHTRIEQTTQSAIVNWQGFDIGRDESVRFAMPNSAAAILNRVAGGNASEIYGRLSSNGNVFLINRNGVVIGQGAVIDTNGFIASTLDVADQDFLNGGDLSFLGDSEAGIANHGVIRAVEGDVLLLAHTVENTGTLEAPEGTAVMAAGTDILYMPDASQAVLVRSGHGGANTGMGVDAGGLLEAASVELKAAGGSVYELAVNQHGVVRATGVEHKDGRIMLTSAGGDIRQAGTLIARNGDDGGEILVGGGYQGNDADVDNAAYTHVTEDAVTDVSAGGARGRGGTAIVWADQATAFFGTARSRGGEAGGDGGFVEVSGRQLLFRPAGIDLSAPFGARGTLLLDPSDIEIHDGNPFNDSQSGNVFSFADGNQDTLLDASVIETALAAASVAVQTNDGGSITLSTDLSWLSGSGLTLESGESITLNGSISGGAGSTLVLLPRESGANVSGTVALAAGNAIDVDTLVLRGHTGGVGTAGDATFSGVIDVGAFIVEQHGGLGFVSAENTANRIDSLIFSGAANAAGLSVRDGAGGLVATLNDPASIGSFSLRTVGDFRLAAGSEVSWQPNPAAVVIEADGGAFINQAGANAFDMDEAQGQVFRVYASDVTNTDTGGLTGTTINNQTFATLPPSDPSLSDTESYFIYETSGQGQVDVVVPPGQSTTDEVIITNTVVTLPINTSSTPLELPEPEEIVVETASIELVNGVTISHAPTSDPATTDDLWSLYSSSAEDTLQEVVADFWAADPESAAAAKDYLTAIERGQIKLSDIMQDAERGDAVAQVLMMSVLPALILELAERDPSTYSSEESLIMAKVADRMTRHRQRLVEVAEQKLAEYTDFVSGPDTGAPSLHGLTTTGFPEVIQDTVWEVSVEEANVLAGSAVAGVAAGSAAAGLAAAGTAAGVIFPHAAAVVGTVAATTVASVAAGTGVIVGGAVFAGVAAVVNLVESGENEAAFNAFVEANSQPVTSVNALMAGGGDEVRAEVINASMRIFGEMFSS